MTRRRFEGYRLTCATCLTLAVGCLFANAAAAQDVASAKPADDAAARKRARLVLHDGSILVGEMKLDSIKVDTKFGQLTVPVEQLHGFRPGLANQPEQQAKLKALIEALGGADAKKQELAKRELTQMGPAVRGQLRAAMSNDKPKRNAQLDAILTALDSQATDEDSESGALILEDTVDTSDFTIVGKIVPDEFTLTNRWGTLRVKVEDIAHARWGGGRQLEDQHKSLTLTGEYLAQLKFKSTGIQVSKGDRIVVKADGMISRSGSSSYRSTPAGVSKFGSYQSSPLIYGGTLVAKLGSGKVFKVGAKAAIVADRDGILRFAIAMRPDYVGRYQFLGQYSVKARVERGEK